jgi:diacylglycerol kinase (ATP)
MDEKTRAFLVYNPVAGTDDAGSSREQIESWFDQADWQLEVHETKPSESTADIVREAIQQPYDFVIAAGGDGTIAGVASGLVGTDIPLGILPLGSGNMVAQEMKIPLDTSGSLQLITGDHRIQSMDALKHRNNYYFLTVSVGVSSQIMQHTRRQEKRRFGFFAYVWNALTRVGKLKKKFYRLTVDEHTEEGMATEIIIMNAGFIGLQSLKASLEIDPADGKMEVCVIRSESVAELIPLLYNILVRGKRDQPDMTCMKVEERVRIETGEPTTIEADGEIIGKTPVEMEIVHHAIRVVVPAYDAETTRENGIG